MRRHYTDIEGGVKVCSAGFSPYEGSGAFSAFGRAKSPHYELSRAIVTNYPPSLQFQRVFPYWWRRASMRVGIGHDTHRLAEGRPLILGGVRIDHPRGLVGHSDADVVLHAVCDALLGAAGLGDIGDAFPDTDQAYKDHDS